MGTSIAFGLDGDSDSTGTLERDGTDRITETEVAYVQDNSVWWRAITARTYAMANSTTATTLSVQKLQLTGLASGTVSNAVSIDINGNETGTTTVINRTTKTVTTTTDPPDADANHNEVNISINGLVQSGTTKGGLQTTYAYDALGRRTGMTDPHTGTNVTAYRTAVPIGVVDYVQDAGSRRTTYDYYTDTGRLKSVTDPNNNVQYSAYTLRGELEKTWGSTYPVWYEYDAYGRKWKMHTYQAESDWSQATWPAGDVTEWLYHAATGLLEQKKDATNHGATYTYMVDGKVLTRTWARGPVTTYGYDNATGELLTISYTNDGDVTPDVVYTYDRLGRMSTAKDGLTGGPNGDGLRTFVYDRPDLQLSSEQIVANTSGLYSKTIASNYEDGSGGTLPGRPNGFSTGGDYGVAYTYDTATGRFEKITGTALPNGGVVYERVKNGQQQVVSELIGRVDFKDGSTPVASLVRTYESDRDVLDRVDNFTQNGATLISGYDYTTDAGRRRTKVVYSGSAFGQQGTVLGRSDWGYNGRNELTDASRFDQATGGTEVVDQYRWYDYDPIGNRASSMRGTDEPLYYCANALNQYTATDDAAGCAPPVTEDFIHDLDGNMTTDATFVYAWDAENRLISVAPTQPTSGAKKLESVYDHMGRRVQKKVSTYYAGTWSVTSTERYVYDDWNVVLVLNGLSSNAVQRKYIWGLDLSDTPDGTGGIGGLLAAQESDGAHEGVYWYLYDSNGNVTQVLKDGATPTLAAHYEYDPCGNVAYSSGTYADANPVRFSTTWLDVETGKYCSDGNPYDPTLGRYLNRGTLENDCPNQYIDTSDTIVDVGNGEGQGLMMVEADAAQPRTQPRRPSASRPPTTRPPTRRPATRPSRPTTRPTTRPSTRPARPRPTGPAKDPPGAVVCWYSSKVNKITCQLGDTEVTCDTVAPVDPAKPLPPNDYLIDVPRNNKLCDGYRTGKNWCDLCPKKKDGSGYWPYQQKNEEGRNQFGLHPGTVSLGCVSIKDSNCWDKLKALFDKGKLPYKGQTFCGTLIGTDKELFQEH